MSNGGGAQQRLDAIEACLCQGNSEKLRYHYFIKLILPEMERFKRIIIIGSLMAHEADPNVSGTVILLKQLISRLKERENIEVKVIDVGALRRSESLLRKIVIYSNILILLFREIENSDLLALHLSPNGFSMIVPACHFLSRLYGKPILFRMFGGLDYTEIPFPNRTIASWYAKKMDCVLFESKNLVMRGMQRKLRKVEWFPNTRPMTLDNLDKPLSNRRKKFVFISQIKIEKGIFELIEAAKLIGSKFQLDVYGPFYDNLTREIFKDVENIVYRGVANPDNVLDILSNSIALILPTYLPAEGYPGIILEAFSVGLPVISTNWKFIPEIVNHENGILCLPRDSQSLKSAIEKFINDPDLQERLSNGSFKSRRFFSADASTENFIRICDEILQINMTRNLVT